MMWIEPWLLKWTGLACCAIATVAGAWLSLAPPGAPIARFADRQVAALDRRMRRQLLAPQGRIIFAAQVAAALAASLLAAVSTEPRWLIALPVVALGPAVVLHHMHARRTRSLEARIDAFTLAFANALRATPNIARALETVVTSVPSPLREEIELTLRELRVGSTLDQALTDLGGRLGSTQFDATLSALLIGRRVGGNVPEILNDTAASLREIVRLQATLRAKTADGRIQAVVLAAFPVGIVLAFDFVMPGYFRPLTQSVAGTMLLGVAAGCWLAAVMLSRQILGVRL